MRNMQAEEIYEKGLHALSNGHVYLALVCFEQAMNLEKSPIYASHLAFCLAKARGQFREAMALCTEALEKDPHNSIHYLNMGRIYLLAGKREKALQVLRQGMQYDHNNEIFQELEKMGTRRPPVISSLRREHPLNKYCGILLKKLGCR
jgi:tetratricopeptide (TPR) repeat protein